MKDCIYKKTNKPQVHEAPLPLFVVSYLLLQFGDQFSHCRVAPVQTSLTSEQRSRTNPGGKLSGEPYILSKMEKRFPGKPHRKSFTNDESLPGYNLNSNISAITFVVCNPDTHYFVHLHRVMFHREKWSQCNDLLPRV